MQGCSGSYDKGDVRLSERRPTGVAGTMWWVRDAYPFKWLLMLDVYNSGEACIGN